MTETTSYDVTITIKVRDGETAKWINRTVKVQALDNYKARRLVEKWIENKGLKAFVAQVRKTPVRLSREQVAARRAALLETIGTEWVHVPDTHKDVTALVKAGSLESEVRVEWEAQGGYYAPNMFGGAGVRKVSRRYVRRVL